jgi:hypothetical protein
LVWLAGFSFEDDFRRRLEQAESCRRRACRSQSGTADKRECTILKAFALGHFRRYEKLARDRGREMDSRGRHGAGRWPFPPSLSLCGNAKGLGTAVDPQLPFAWSQIGQPRFLCERSPYADGGPARSRISKFAHAAERLAAT